MPRVKSISRQEPHYSKNSRQSAEGVGARVGGRLKKAKIVFDPSINNLPKKITRSQSVSVENFPTSSRHSKSNSSGDNMKKSSKRSESPPVLDLQVADYCLICGKVDARKTKKLIACIDCSYRVHSSCLKITYVNHALLEEHWRCDNCRTCVVCYETSETGSLVSCCVCVDAYHLGCHTPRISSNKTLNRWKWECTKCLNINKSVIGRKVSQSDDKRQASPTRSEKSVGTKNSKEIRDKKLETNGSDDNIKAPIITAKEKDDNMPDISNWSCERVSKYIEEYFPKEAHKFREHDIDGASLLLMKRSDIIKGLALKLGPAIRIYSFIVKLQSQSNDPRLTWM